jgi:uncharacterized RDD family membrane protein YckC
VQPVSDDPWIGAAIDHFTIEAPLGKGGMGAVYLAHDRSLDRKVAIKILSSDLAGEPERDRDADPDPERDAERDAEAAATAAQRARALEERFTREARAQARLTSPFVVVIYHIGHASVPSGKGKGKGKGSGNGTEEEPPKTALYFAMEVVPGDTLEAVLDAGKTLEPERARHMMLAVANGLRTAHEGGIIHRDIKPSNLLVTKDGRIKIADFGLAKPLTEDDPRITEVGMLLGSPAYMAPEQARGEEIDARADMYALGCTFYHLLVGQPPFDGPNPIAVIAKHMTLPVPRVADKAPAVPHALSTIVERLTKKDPKDRFATYDALIAALEAAAPQAVTYAGVTTRAAALGIDAVIAATLVAFLGPAGLFVHLVYVTVGHAVFGQTFGKYLLNIEVRRLGGGRIGLARSVARTLVAMWLPALVGVVILLTQGRHHLAEAIARMKPSELSDFRGVVVAFAVSNVLLTLLYAVSIGIAAFHPQKRAVHDFLGSSEVVYRLR